MAERLCIDCFVFENIQLYSQNHKIALLSQPVGHQKRFTERFNAKKLQQNFIERISVLAANTDGVLTD